MLDLSQCLLRLAFSASSATQASSLFLAFSQLLPTSILLTGFIRRSKMIWVEDVLRTLRSAYLQSAVLFYVPRGNPPIPFSQLPGGFIYCTQTEHHSFRLKDASRTCDLSLSPGLLSAYQRPPEAWILFANIKAAQWSPLTFSLSPFVENRWL